MYANVKCDGERAPRNYREQTDEELTEIILASKARQATAKIPHREVLATRTSASRIARDQSFVIFGLTPLEAPSPEGLLTRTDLKMVLHRGHSSPCRPNASGRACRQNPPERVARKWEKPALATQERTIQQKIADDGSVHYSSVTSAPDDSTAVCYMVPHRVIPVVFVPGVMGTNLAKKDSNPPEPVWLLDDNTTIGPWMMKGAADRKRILDPDKTQVFCGGRIPPGTAQTEDELRRRGWGEVAYKSYGEWLVWLENALNDANAGTDYGRKGLRESLCHIVTPGLEKLERDEVALSYKYQFPVHAVGYNWLQSNAVSAARLASRIDEITAWYRKQFNYRCDRVILVTHSMGGLVARYYSEVMGKRDAVLGIVHGVMPATGAAATYKRMKTGTEGAGVVGTLTAFALGPNAATMTAVVGNAPGPLQLLPSRDYGMGWLRIRDSERFVALPQADKAGKVDPYSQIYTVRGTWWGLCDDQLLNPLDTGKKAIDQNWKTFADLILDDVQPFHDDISGKYHANTYAFYGDDEKHLAYGNVTWTQQTPPLLRGGVPSTANLLGTRGSDDPATGGQLVATTQDGKPTVSNFVLRDAEEHGDGTVPVRSGRALGQQVRACTAFAGIDHEGAYKLDATRRFTLHAITRIAQNLKGTTLDYKA
ncbi:hypothetical protein [Paraburkholderia sp. J10-1]|uniref:esterase/lipase family protein n=1 Tax=Paraburkholderia sp. J10-1 TaxID=2805430 RepID=UPI002AB6AEF4|nr:hypothetical protein [Paraburkholderia sp. J10-1]